MKNKRKIAVLYESRNDYNVLEEIYYKKSFSGIEDIYTMNVDVYSSDESKEYFRDVIQKKYGVIDINHEGIDVTPTIRGYELAIKHIEENNLPVEWLLVTQHDMSVPTHYGDFWSNLEKEIDKKIYKERVGTIGFGINNMPKMGVVTYGRGSTVGGMIGSERDCYYNNLPKEYLETDYFVVECPYWNFYLINIEMFKKYIIPDYNFLLNFVGDDLTHQFNLKNVFNIAIPKFVINDESIYKENILHVPSCNGGKSSKHFHLEQYVDDPYRWQKIWNNKYGYPFFYKNEREREMMFNMYKTRFFDTIMEKLFDLHINDGPKKIEDFDISD